MRSASRHTQVVIDAIEMHHGRIRAELARLVDALVSAVAAHEQHEPARQELVAYLHGDLLLHLESERRLLHVAGSSFESSEKLAHCMEIGHRQILEQCHTLGERDRGIDLAVAAGTVLALIELRLETENTVLLPDLVANGVDLETLLAGRPEIVGDTPDGV